MEQFSIRGISKCRERIAEINELIDIVFQP